MSEEKDVMASQENFAAVERDLVEHLDTRGLDVARDLSSGHIRLIKFGAPGEGGRGEADISPEAWKILVETFGRF